MKTMWVAMLAVWMGAVTGWGESQLIQHKGECTVQDVDAFKTDKHVKISYGEDVTFECGVFATEMMGEYRLRATPVVKNNTDGPVKVWYFLAFFDADGNLLACNADSRKIEAGQSSMQGYSCGFDRENLGQITAYQSTLFVRPLSE